MAKKGVILGFFLLISALITLYGCTDTITYPEKPEMPKEPKFMPEELFNASCSTDSDCLEVGERFNGDNCCGGCATLAVNVKAAELRRKWIAENCGPVYNTAYYCPVFECIMTGEAKAVCINNSCVSEGLLHP